MKEKNSYYYRVSTKEYQVSIHEGYGSHLSTVYTLEQLLKLFDFDGILVYVDKCTPDGKVVQSYGSYEKVRDFTKASVKYSNKHNPNLKIIELINKLLNQAYQLGWEVGASHDPSQSDQLVDPSGYLKNDTKIGEQLRNTVNELFEELGYPTDKIIVYYKEDTGTHPEDWDYIAPEIALK